MHSRSEVMKLIKVVCILLGDFLISVFRYGDVTNANEKKIWFDSHDYLHSLFQYISISLFRFHFIFNWNDLVSRTPSKFSILDIFNYFELIFSLLPLSTQVSTPQMQIKEKMCTPKSKILAFSKVIFMSGIGRAESFREFVDLNRIVLCFDCE